MLHIPTIQPAQDKDIIPVVELLKLILRVPAMQTELVTEPRLTTIPYVMPIQKTPAPTLTTTPPVVARENFVLPQPPNAKAVFPLDFRPWSFIK